MEILEVDSVDACRDIWQSIVPQESVFDLWSVRECFWRHYRGQLLFLVARSQSGCNCGLLALAGTDADDEWGFFPGETWMGKTWLERNRIIASSREVYNALLDRCPQGAYLRYLSTNNYSDDTMSVDETGYIFEPAKYDYSIENFWSTFSGKSRKRLCKGMDDLTGKGVEIRRGILGDVETMFDLNVQSFGERSYFSERRFYSGFRDMIAWLDGQGCLGVTTVLIDGTVAAVDVSAVYRNTCTVLAGGTHPEFPGVAKLINFTHLNWACQQRYVGVDFLCGDFGWKQRFHLTPMPMHHYRSSLPHGA